MKKLLLLIPLLFLCSCANVNNTQQDSTSNLTEFTMYAYGKNSDDYYYWFFIDYQQGGSLIIARTPNANQQYQVYKKFPFGKYEYIYTYTKYGSNECVYDYGDYAIWVKSGI